MSSKIFTGYDPSFENREELENSHIDFDFTTFCCAAEVPPTRGIMEKMTREDQFSMNSCAGFGLVHAAQVAFYLQTGDFREFNPHWSYRAGQRVDRRNTDNGCSIGGVIKGGKTEGLLPQDIENDGTLDFPYPRDQYNFRYPASASEVAAKRKIGYSAAVPGWEGKLNFLQAGQGAIVIGGSWGNWAPDADGICREFRPSPRGPFHARAYVDWITIGGEVYLVEANSHFKQYGKKGYAFHNRRFVEAQDRDTAFVAAGVSDITLGPGDKPKERPFRWISLT